MYSQSSFGILLTSVRQSNGFAVIEVIFFRQNTSDVQCLSRCAAIMTAAFPSRSGRQTNFKLPVNTFLPLTEARKVPLLQMSRSHALGHANAITWTFPPRCCWLREPLLCTFPCPLLLLPTVLSYLLLSSSSCCHSVTLHLLTPLSLAPSARLSPPATTFLKNEGKLSLLSAAFFFSPLSRFMHRPCLCAVVGVLVSVSCFVLPRDTLVSRCGNSISGASLKSTCVCLRCSKTANFLIWNNVALHIQHVHRSSLSPSLSLSPLPLSFSLFLLFNLQMMAD